MPLSAPIDQTFPRKFRQILFLLSPPCVYDAGYLALLGPSKAHNHTFGVFDEFVVHSLTGAVLVRRGVSVYCKEINALSRI